MSRTAVRLREIAPRLACQAHPVPTTAKIELVERLVDAGVREFELSSFVRPDLVPGLADAREVFAHFRDRPGLTLDCCIGNEHGLRAAAAAGAHRATFLLSADEGFARANTGRPVAATLDQLEGLVTTAAGLGIELASYVIFAWGGPTGPARSVEDIAPLTRRMAEAGVGRCVLADSSGYAAPPQIRALVEATAAYFPLDRVTVQIHDDRGLGVADVLELATLGVGTIDAALGGSGGHPAFPDGRGGGVCTEDAAQALELAGYDTGLDLAALSETSAWLATLGVPTPGALRRVGPVPRPEDAPAELVFSW